MSKTCTYTASQRSDDISLPPSISQGTDMPDFTNASLQSDNSKSSLTSHTAEMLDNNNGVIHSIAASPDFSETEDETSSCNKCGSN